MLIQTKDPKLIRDTSSMLLSNIDEDEKNAYINRRNVIKKQNEKITNIENDIKEMKDILKKLAGMVNGD